MCAGVCLIDRCVCVQECQFDLFGWVFLVRVVMYWFVLHTWHWDLHGYSSVLGFGQVVSSYPGSCFLYSMKVMALFSNSPSNDNSVQNCKTVLHIFTSLSKSIASYIRFLKC